MRLIRRVAELKAQARLPSFDREREGALLDDLLSKAAEADVPADIIRDVYAALLSASRAAQRRVLHAGETHFSIGILGGTAGMGMFLAKLLDGAGYPGRNDGARPRRPERGGRVEARPRHRGGANRADCTCNRRGRAPRPPRRVHRRRDEREGGADARDARPRARGRQRRGDSSDLRPARRRHGSAAAWSSCGGAASSGYERVKHLYESFGAEVIEATAEEHDAQMALIQVLLHEKTLVLGSVLERLKADLARTRNFASPIYRAELSMIGRMFFQRAELYAGDPHLERGGARDVATPSRRRLRGSRGPWEPETGTPWSIGSGRSPPT